MMGNDFKKHWRESPRASSSAIVSEQTDNVDAQAFYV